MFTEAKLSVPRLWEQILPRKHLLDRLSAGRDRPLIVVSGLAGSGKTTLVSQWITEEKLPVSWYSLDRSDDSWEVFIRGIVAASAMQNDRLATVAGECLPELLKLPAPEALSRFIRWSADFGGAPYLVLDDFHVITSGAVQSAIESCLRHPFPGMRFVIVSRHSLPFSVARLRLRNQLTEISSRDLGFSRSETERFFSGVAPPGLSKTQLREVTRHMEGWAGGLRLFGLSLREGAAAGFAGDALGKACRDAEEYLVDEVIGRQPRDVMKFLSLTSHLERFTPDLCRKVTGMRASPEILDRLYRSNMFLVPLGREETWFRYHHLFRTAVRRHAALPESAISRIHRRAAVWCARNGRIEDALRHAFSSKDYGFAAKLLEDSSTLLYDRCEFLPLRRWIARLPQDLLDNHPLLSLHECRFKMESMQWTGLASAVTGIESRSAHIIARYDEGRKRLCSDLRSLLECLPYCFDPEHLDEDELGKCLSRISPQNRAAAAFISVIIPRSYIYQGKIGEAREALREIAPSVLSSGSIISSILWFRTMATVERLQWRLSDSERVLEEGLSFLNGKGAGARRLKLLLYVPMAWIHYLRDNLPMAFRLATLGVQCAEQTGFVYEIADGYFLLSMIHRALHQDSRRDQCLEKMQRGAQALGSPSYIALVEAFIARFWALEGNIPSVEQWAHNRRFDASGEFSYRYITECLTYALLRFAQGRLREAADMLEVLYGRCLEQGVMQEVLEIDLLSSAVLLPLHESGQSRDRMEHAITLAETEQCVRVFVNRLRIISPVLTDLVTARPRSPKLAYLLTIAAACGIDPHAPASPGPRRGAERLTFRETQILELMASGYKNKEIAEKAFVSLDTVRTHLKHVFDKLDARTRVQAIRRAEELGILPQPAGPVIDFGLQRPS